MARVPVGIVVSVRAGKDREQPLDVVVITCEGGCNAWTPHARDVVGEGDAAKILYRCACCKGTRQFGSMIPSGDDIMLRFSRVA